MNEFLHPTPVQQTALGHLRADGDQVPIAPILPLACILVDLAGLERALEETTEAAVQIQLDGIGTLAELLDVHHEDAPVLGLDCHVTCPDVLCASEPRASVK
jgi:hypothetical protein